LLLAEWADEVGPDGVSIEEMWEIHEQVPTVMEDMSLKEATGLIVNMLRKHFLQSVIVPMCLTSEANTAMRQLEAGETGDPETFNMDAWGGFFGMKLPWISPHIPVLRPKDVADLITLSSIIWHRTQLLL
jgi:hypothetical protein